MFRCKTVYKILFQKTCYLSSVTGYRATCVNIILWDSAWAYHSTGWYPGKWFLYTLGFIDSAQLICLDSQLCVFLAYKIHVWQTRSCTWHC